MYKMIQLIHSNDSLIQLIDINMEVKIGFVVLKPSGQYQP